MFLSNIFKTEAEFSSDGEALRPCGAQWMAEGADRLYSVFVRNERSDGTSAGNYDFNKPFLKKTFIFCRKMRGVPGGDLF